MQASSRQSLDRDRWYAAVTLGLQQGEFSETDILRRYSRPLSLYSAGKLGQSSRFIGLWVSPPTSIGMIYGFSLVHLNSWFCANTHDYLAVVIKVVRSMDGSRP